MLVDLGEPETDRHLEPVLRDLRPGTETLADNRGEPGLLLEVMAEACDKGFLLRYPGGEVGDLLTGKPGFSSEPGMFRLLLLELVEPGPDCRVGTGRLLDPVVLGLFIRDKGKGSLASLLLGSLTCQFLAEGLLLLEEPCVRGLLLGKDPELPVEDNLSFLEEDLTFLVLPDGSSARDH